MAKKAYTGQGGPNNRPKRYPARLTTQVSEDARGTLEEMSKVQGKKVAHLVRRSVMKDVYIYKAEKKRHQEIEEELGNEE